MNHVIRQAVDDLDLVGAHVVLDAEALERIVGLHLMHDEHFAIDYDDFVLDVDGVLVVIIHPLKRLLLHFLLTAQSRLRGNPLSLCLQCFSLGLSLFDLFH